VGVVRKESRVAVKAMNTLLIIGAVLMLLGCVYVYVYVQCVDERFAKGRKCAVVRKDE
jgi:hypothetical protein